ncbi:MAG: nucleotidyl transferase AbiEii/AbiGii toxin family protein [Gammaproteobacteria bacterium]|nr:nucleotidyl transferase AbiEii/AbiGii toxin family protein [Gammaproteobacteria bacterium]
MTKQIIELLKNKIAERVNSGLSNVEILRNIIKEEIQYYLLNFIYHHQEYSKWTMYGGSALRICYGLNRMSVDLDFEIDHECTQPFLANLKGEIEGYFADNYELESDTLTVKVVNGRGLLLRFTIGDEIGINHHSKQVHVKVDLNYFIPPHSVTENIPINSGQLSFVIKTYNLSTLMASKIAAILLRGIRRVGKETYEEKGRDIYDLLWYMGKKVVPDLNYLCARAKNFDIADLHALFDRLTLQMSKVDNKNLQHDLSPLFLDQGYIKNWLMQWHESYLRLVKSYNIHRTTGLCKIFIHQDFDTDNYSFIYSYNTEDDYPVTITYVISNYWLDDWEGKISTEIDNKLLPLINVNVKRKANDRLKQYATLFYNKNSAYLKSLNNVIVGDAIQTRIICTMSCSPNQRKITLTRSALLACELEDLML